jgi:porin
VPGSASAFDRPDRTTASRAGGPAGARARLRRIALLLAIGLALPSHARSEPDGWLERSRLTGDWGGRRSALIERGVTLGASYTGGTWTNVRGGFETGTRLEGFARWWLELDLESLLGWRGVSFDADAYSYHGGQASSDLVGPFYTQTLSGWETSASVRLYRLLLRQTWADERIQLKIGQLAADSDFFATESALVLLNGTFGFLGSGRALEISPFYPLAAPGAHLYAETGDGHWVAQVGVYTADMGLDERDNHGLDWTFGKGASVLAELRARRRPFDREGIYALGIAATTADVQDYATGGTRPGGYSLYAVLDQTVLEASRGPRLGLFLRSYGSPQPDRSLLLWYVDGGLRVDRPLPGRDDDVVSLGFAHSRFGDDYVDATRAEDGSNISRCSTLIELTYRLQATAWLSLQPSVQVHLDPHLSRRDATVIGLRAVIDL